MPSNKFYLDEQKTNEIELSWRGFWKDITVKHNGHVLGGFQNLAHLKQGQIFQLHDGSQLSIHYSTSYGDQGIRVSVNGYPLKGSSGDPEVRLKSIFGIAAFFGALSFVLGTIGEFGDIDAFRKLGVDWTSMVAGAVLAGLGYCTWKFRSVVALIIMCILVGADGMLTLFYSLAAGGTTGLHGMFLKVFLIIAFVKGFSAIRELKEQEVIGDRNPQNRNPFQ